MDIRFVSSLTADDEDVFAPALMTAVSALLDLLPIAYTIRIETAGSLVFQHTHAGAGAAIALETLEGAPDARRVRLPGAGGNGTPRS